MMKNSLPTFIPVAVVFSDRAVFPKVNSCTERTHRNRYVPSHFATQPGPCVIPARTPGSEIHRQTDLRPRPRLAKTLLGKGCNFGVLRERYGSELSQTVE